MALSEHEQQMLKEIEQSLLSEDPKFGAVVTDGDFARSKGTVIMEVRIKASTIGFRDFNYEIGRASCRERV